MEAAERLEAQRQLGTLLATKHGFAGGDEAKAYAKHLNRRAEGAE